MGAHLEAADAALAEHDFGAALAHAEAAVALDRFSERAQRSEMMALYAVGRTHEALGRYRSFRMRLDEELGLEPTGETRALESALIRQEDVHSLLPRPILRAKRETAGRALHLLGRTTEIETLARAVRQAHDGDLALIQIEGEAGLGKTRLLDELVGELDGVRVGRASCSELERHLPYVPLATALRDALADVDLDACRMPALAQLLPELVLDSPGPEFEEVEVLEALVALVAEHGPIVLLDRRPPVGRPQDTRGPRIPAAAGRRSCGGARDDSAGYPNVAGRPAPPTGAGHSPPARAALTQAISRRSEFPTSTNRRAAIRDSSPRRSRTDPPPAPRRR